MRWREASADASLVCPVGKRTRQTCLVYVSRRSAWVSLLLCWLRCCSYADFAARLEASRTLMSPVVVHSPCCLSAFFVTTVMMSPLSPVCNKFMPSRFRIAMCAAIRWLCSSFLVSACPVGKTFLKTVSFHGNVDPEYLHVRRRCGRVSSGW